MASNIAPAATAAETVERTFKPLQQFTRGWMMAEETRQYGTDLGLKEADDFRTIGRAGVLGSCPVDVAVGALAFQAPDEVTAAWKRLPVGLSHVQVAEHYIGLVIGWGERTLTVFDADRLERLTTLGRRIVDAAPASLGPLFAGWRAVPEPQGVYGRVALTTQVMREMRGAAHINAIIAMGLTPLDAILASTNAPPRTGPGYAERMGFKGPFRNPEEVRAVYLAYVRSIAAHTRILSVDVEEARSVPVWSEAQPLPCTARIAVVEVDQGGGVVPSSQSRLTA